MAISKKIKKYMNQSSWIRKMFEEGNKLRAQYGASEVFDYTLGNPILEPPAIVKETLRELVLHPQAGMHRYMSNAGYPETRQAVAAYMKKLFNLPFTANSIVMTVGAGGGLNVVLKSILDAGDEVILNTPYFVEYIFYADNHGGVPVFVNTTKSFDLDVAAIERAITDKTKAIIINTPNNPTGSIYSEASLIALSEVLCKAQQKYNKTIYVLSDEPYRKVVFDNAPCPCILSYYRNSVVVNSHSKDLALPGERIGYIAMHPEIDCSDELMDALIFCNRTLGFVNAPALQQHIVERCIDATVDMTFYKEKRDLLCDRLMQMGYKMVKPMGTFYIFPETPIPDDIAFINIALKRRLLLVPGAGFGSPGYFRISYCAMTTEMIARSIPLFEEALKEATA